MRNIRRGFSRHLVSCISVVLIVIIAILGLFWLSVSLLILAASFKFFEYNCKRIKADLLKQSAYFMLVVTYVFIVSVGTKLFLIDIYRIPSVSMENTLFTNDVILVNKLVYGPRLPDNLSDISWMKLIFPGRPAEKKSNNSERVYSRAKGISELKQGDVFVYELKPGYFVVKRCVAGPGDTMALINGDIYTNGIKYASPESVKNNYKLSINEKHFFFALLDSLSAAKKVVAQDPSRKYLIGAFTSKEISAFRKDSQIKITKLIDSVSKEKKLFAVSKSGEWTYDNMGPFVVPARGMKIELTPEHVAIYKRVLNRFEGIKLELKGAKYYIDGQIALFYTFKQNYYFAMGDHRKEALDSRYTGFIPEEDIIGKSSYVIFSNYNDRFNWDRLFKTIH